jgi:hypothetical protein
MNIKSRRMRWERLLVDFIVEIRNAHRILIGRSKEKGPLRRLEYKGEDNSKMKLKETGCERRD